MTSRLSDSDNVAVLKILGMVGEALEARAKRQAYQRTSGGAVVELRPHAEYPEDICVYVGHPQMKVLQEVDYLLTNKFDTSVGIGPDHLLIYP